MKSIKITVFLLAVLACSITQAQSEADYSALASFLPAEKLAGIQNNQVKYSQYAYLNRHGYYIADYGSKDVSEYPELSEVMSLYPNAPELNGNTIANGDLNLMAYNFRMEQDNYVYYRIAGSNKLLVILPISVALKNLNSETE